MKYRQELAKKRLALLFFFLKKLTKKILAILLMVLLIIALFLLIYFVRDVILGQTTLSEFKHSFYGVPADELLEINKQLQNQNNNLKEWLDSLTKRLSS